MNIVRNMSKEDLKTCADIFVEVYREVYSEPWTIETAGKRIEEIFNQSQDLCFVLEIKAEICGFLAATRFSWHDGLRIQIEEIVLNEKSRGQGYGTLLLQTLEQQGHAAGVVGYSLISKKGSKAYHYYLDRGFSVSAWTHLEKLQHKI